jgi:hypothetical protein
VRVFEELERHFPLVELGEVLWDFRNYRVYCLESEDSTGPSRDSEGLEREIVYSWVDIKFEPLRKWCHFLDIAHARCRICGIHSRRGPHP